MNIPFLDLRKVNNELAPVINLAVQKVLNSGWYILGEQGKEFESNMAADLFGEKQGYVSACNSGTDALVLSLLAADVSPGDEVITVSHTAIPTITAIVAVGAQPVFTDIDAATWVMDVSKIASAVSTRTKAIIPVHLYGNMVNIAELRNVLCGLNREDIVIIEDVAQAQGARFRGLQAGTHGHFGAFSFYPSKNIGALGDGGAVACQSRQDWERINMLRNYGQRDRYNAIVARGINSRLDEIQAAILNIKLGYLHEWNQQKARIMYLYRTELANLPVAFQQVTKDCEPAWHLCVVQLPDKQMRDALLYYLEENSIQTLVHYPIPTHLQGAFAVGQSMKLPVTEDLANRIVSLPFNIMLSEAEQWKVIESVKTFFK